MNEVLNVLWNNKEWLFSGLGVTVLCVLIKYFLDTRNGSTHTMKQHNVNYSHGTQIGIQKNYYGEKDDDGK